MGRQELFGMVIPVDFRTAAVRSKILGGAEAPHDALSVQGTASDSKGVSARHLFESSRVNKDMYLRLLPITLLMVTGVLRAQFVGSISVSEQYLFSAANAERAQRHLSALRWDDALYRAADQHAREMAARRSIAHQYPGEAELSARGRAAGARFSKIAENVAESPDAVAMQDAWMHSPGHRANLLDPEVDSVGIRVLRRDGELYAVEDFDRSVAILSLDEQESAVGGQLQAVARIAVLAPSEDSRRTCRMETGFAGDQQPGFVIRYTSADLTKLPESLTDKLMSGRYSQAMVGACTIDRKQTFTTYSIAVMLFR